MIGTAKVPIYNFSVSVCARMAALTRSVVSNFRYIFLR